MKKYFKLLSLILTLSFFASCDQNDALIVFDNENGQTLLQLVNNSGTMPTPPEGITSFEVNVLVSTVSKSDRAIIVEIDSSVDNAATADQYTISNLVIPANSYSGTVTVTSNYDAIPEVGSSLLVIKITNLENSSEVVVEKGTLTLELFRKCPIVIEDFVGTWSGTDSWGYETQVVTTLNSEGELMLTGVGFEWMLEDWGEIVVSNTPVKVDVNLETGELVIEEQPYISTTYKGGAEPPYLLKGTGIITNSCSKKLELEYIFVQPGYDWEFDGTTWGPKFKETIQLLN